MASAQELTDRLVVAVDEEDILFVLYWLKEMEVAQCLVQGIHGKHSWKRYSAVTSIARNPPSPYRKLILQLLLLKGLSIDLSGIRDLRQLSRNGMVSEVVIEMIEKWKMRERENAIYATLLLSIPVEQAANWIDTSLPPPPNVATLTGYSPLPPAPSGPYVPASKYDCGPFGYHIPPSEVKDPLPYGYRIPPNVEFSFSFNPGSESPPRPGPHRRHQIPYLRRTSYFAQGLTHASRQLPDAFNLEPPFSKPHSIRRILDPVSLAFARFPQGFTCQDLVDLFPRPRPALSVARFVSSTNETYAILQVERDVVQGLVEWLDGIELGGRRRMRCFITEMTGDEVRAFERQFKRSSWTSDLIDDRRPFYPGPSTPSTPSTSALPKPTLVRKSRISLALSLSSVKASQRLASVPTTVLVFGLPFNVNMQHFQRFETTKEKCRFQRYKEKQIVVAIIKFDSKRSAGMFCHRYNEREKKRGRTAVMVDSDKTVGECIKEHFATIDSTEGGVTGGAEATIGCVGVGKAKSVL